MDNLPVHVIYMTLLITSGIKSLLLTKQDQVHQLARSIIDMFMSFQEAITQVINLLRCLI